jgi:CubicO group peptidase (beta-lactamase class C family)
MKARSIAIRMLLCLGLMGVALASGAISSPGEVAPSQQLQSVGGQVEDLSTFITTQMQEAKVPGLSIALIQDGEITWVAGFGEANSLTGKPVAGDTVFDVASISKTITAYAALKLVEQGGLSLDEPVQHYISRPWLPASANAEQITLRQLLTHTSGLGNQVNPVNKSILFTPGERYEYSGVGFLYLQEVMEQTTGKPLEQIAKELVFEPLKMDSSSFVTPTNMMPRLAYGHMNYGGFMFLLGVVLAVVFILTLLVGLVIRRIQLGRFSLSGKLLLISYIIAASITLAIEVYIVDSGINKWTTLTALWLIVFGAGMALLLIAGRKLVALLPGKWQRPQIRVPLLVVWSIISALVILLLTNSLSGPVPRSPAGNPSAAYSLRSTAPDLANFLLELNSPQHLDPALMAEMTSAQVQVEDDLSWGLGMGILQSPHGTLVWHDGNNPDFKALMVINKEQMDGVVLLTNGENGRALVRAIASHALGVDFAEY